MLRDSVGWGQDLIAKESGINEFPTKDAEHFCISYFSVAVTKHHDQRQFIEESIFGLWLQRAKNPIWQLAGSAAEVRSEEMTSLIASMKEREN